MRFTVPTAILLDETPLSLLTQKRGHTLGDACRAWYTSLVGAGHRFYVPEATDYELRRELLRTGRAASLGRLDAFNLALPDRYLPLSTADWRTAALLWAQVRNAGRTTAPPEALDGDTLIAAQAQRPSLFPAGMPVIVATANVSHLARLTTAALWSDIQP